MISKIAGHNEFQKILKRKETKAFLDKTANNTKRVTETVKAQGETISGFQQQTPYDAYLSQQPFQKVKMAQLFKKE